MASIKLFLSSGLLSKSLFRPISFSLLCPIAFSAYRSFKSMPLHPVASSPKSTPPLLRPVASSPIAFSTNTSFKAMPRLLRLFPLASTYRSFNTMPPLLHPVASPTIAFSTYSSFNSMPPLLRPATSSTYRSFNTNTMSHKDDPNVVVDAPPRPNFLYSYARSLFFYWITKQVFNKFDRFLKQVRARETEDSLHVRMYLRGCCKEDVKISVDHNTLSITDSKQSKRRGRSRFSGTVDLTGKRCKIDEITAEMKEDHVLKILVPKMKEEETQERNNNDVIFVKVK